MKRQFMSIPDRKYDDMAEVGKIAPKKQSLPCAFTWAGLPTHLRAYLKKLPDFDDVEAEERAMAHALGFSFFEMALAFFKEWPDQNRAAQLVLARASEINGNAYYLLDPAARLIEGKHPLAATLLRRAMIEDTLAGAKSTRYKHAARHLLECSSLASNIRDFGTFETHDVFVARLRTRHARKSGFWAQVAGSSEGRP
jgi:hypothetical protein